MSTIELPPAMVETAELASAASEKPFTGSVLDADAQDWDASEDASIQRESPEDRADGVFPGYPLS